MNGRRLQSAGKPGRPIGRSLLDQFSRLEAVEVEIQKPEAPVRGYLNILA